MAMENQNGILNQFGFSLNSETLKAKIIKNIKYPVIVFVLSFLISLPEFNRFLFGFFPRLLLESGQVGIGGVFLKALIGMILFSLISLVV
jgi:type II secretory pathway component PulF